MERESPSTGATRRYVPYRHALKRVSLFCSRFIVLRTDEVGGYTDEASKRVHGIRDGFDDVGKDQVCGLDKTFNGVSLIDS